MSYLLALTLTFLSLTNSSPAALVQNRHLPQRSDICPVVFPTSTDNRIVGGDFFDPFIRSHLISFHYEGCSGSVITRRLGITAVQFYVGVESEATVGGTKSGNGVHVPMKRIIKHSDFSFPLNDIMLIEFAEFAEDVPERTIFVYVNADDSIPEIGEYTRSAGLGHTNEEDNPNSDKLLYQVDIPVVTTESCAKILTPLSPLLLAEDVNNKMQICAGDAPEASEEDDQSDTSGPEVSDNNERNPEDGGVKVDVLMGSIFGVLGLVSIFVVTIVLLRRRTAAHVTARSEMTGITESTDDALTMIAEASVVGSLITASVTSNAQKNTLQVIQGAFPFASWGL